MKPATRTLTLREKLRAVHCASPRIRFCITYGREHVKHGRTRMLYIRLCCLHFGVEHCPCLKSGMGRHQFAMAPMPVRRDDEISFALSTPATNCAHCAVAFELAHNKGPRPDFKRQMGLCVAEELREKRWVERWPK